MDEFATVFFPPAGSDWGGFFFFWPNCSFFPTPTVGSFLWPGKAFSPRRFFCYPSRRTSLFPFLPHARAWRFFSRTSLRFPRLVHNRFPLSISCSWRRKVLSFSGFSAATIVRGTGGLFSVTPGRPFFFFFLRLRKGWWRSRSFFFFLCAEIRSAIPSLFFQRQWHEEAPFSGPLGHGSSSLNHPRSAFFRAVLDRGTLSPRAWKIPPPFLL